MVSPGDCAADSVTVSSFSGGERSEPTPPLTRGETKSGGSYSSTDLKNRHLIFNGRHLPYNPDNTDKARQLRKNMTPEEKKLWYGFLRKHPLRFLRQKPVHHYILDFYCAKLRLGIEIDGSQHFTKIGQKYDKNRTGILSVFGLTVLRFTNKEVNENFEGVCRAIQAEIDNLVRLGHLR